MLVYIQSGISIILSIISSITDFKDKKIYNKNIIVAIGFSAITYIVLREQIEIEYVRNFMINLIISIIISFLFFYFKIWAAGDAKLFLALIFMIPYEIYEGNTKNVFPALYLLILIFSIAFLYVVFETIYLWIKDKEKIEKLKIFNNKADLKEFIISYFMGYFVVLFINNILFRFFYEFRINNYALIMLCNMLILIFIYQVITTKRKMLILTGIFLSANIIYYCIYGFAFYSINLRMLVIVIVIMLFRNVSENYNYQEIKIEELKPRMILSYQSVIQFYSSKVKGLPQSTTESTDSRLTQDEVDSIKRWSKTRKGKETIVIVRHMPFAPFMLLGNVVFFIIKLYS